MAESGSTELGHPLHAAVVRVRSHTGEIVGGGFLVSERHIMTCAHVVADALGIAEDTVEAPNREVALDFPLVAPGATLAGTVVAWAPVRLEAETNLDPVPEDVAILELGAAPPAGAIPLRCAAVGDPWKRSFRSFGFPSGHNRGVWASGVLRGPRDDGLVQIEAEGQVGYFVEPGFSGAPVWDDGFQAVLGMVMLADRRRETRVAFVAPTRLLRRAWPALGRVAPEVRDTPHQLSPITLIPHSQPPVTSFVGRTKTVQEILSLLRREGVSLITVTGSGGVGKTRVAWQVMDRTIDDFPDGMAFVPLVTIKDPALVIPTIALSLRLSQSADSVIDDLKRHLESKRFLLVLDNIEHLLEAWTAVVEIRDASPKLRILITSREPLNVSGEHEVRVPPLELPPHEAIEQSGPSQLGQFEALQLFVKRAQEHDNAFSLSASNAQAIAQICARLDGIPLAIELAAARLRFYQSPQELLARLGQRLQELKGGPRDAHERHRTMRNTIAWSYELLRREEQEFFRRLSITVGSFSLEAAQAMVNAVGDPSTDIHEGIESLCEKSLIQVVVSASNEPRYGMLETIREFGAEQLRECGEEEALQRAHASFYLQLVERVKPQLVGPNQKTWLDRLSDDHENLRAVLTWTRDGGEGDLGLRLANLLPQFWLVRGHVEEGGRWLEHLNKKSVDPYLKLDALLGAGWLGWAQGHPGRAKTFLEEALYLSKHLGDKTKTAWSLHHLGNVAHAQGKYLSAETQLAESAALFEALKDDRARAWSLHHLANVARDQGQYPRAARLQKESLELFQRPAVETEKDIWGLAWAHHDLGNIARDLGNFTEAFEELSAGLRLFRDLDDRRGIAWSYHNLGIVERDRGNHKEALEWLVESRKLFERLGDRRGQAWAIHNIGSVALEQGDRHRAGELQRNALDLFEDLGEHRGVAWAQHALNMSTSTLVPFEDLQVRLEEHVIRLRALDDLRGLAWALHDLATETRRRGNAGTAVPIHEEAVRLFEILGERAGQGWAYRNLGIALQQRGGEGDHACGKRILEEALALFKRQGDLRGLAWTYHALSAAADNSDEAFEWLDLALVQFRQVDDRSGIAWGIHKRGILAWQQNDCPQAARLLLRAEALRDKISMKLSFGEQREFDQALKDLKSKLDDTKLDSIRIEEHQAILEDFPNLSL